ncbi:uncharacterized protein B0P05DRAFT_546578 [Gilbertella persicaria]|uniref:uncharacterized protein n=1 Tax=Gilbertella persicaria TaxID=101096 RepID=UPI002220D6B3|nr:uncharacterized protein B0P05DRAFT_546578 [Gilbertella persicaria]KAI8075831.1 hypothetical protein B0P05DRAFT_546578 [Gilbertella persicaria]
MDPGQKYVQNLKSVPNLVSEEPSIITPTNTSFVDVPWSDFAKLLAQKRKTTAEKCKNNPLPESEDYSPTQPAKSSIEDFRIGNWDAATGYQDKEHNVDK